MSDPIATAFVRIRPSTLGFQQEAAAQLATSLAGVQSHVTGTGRAAGVATTEFDHFNRGLILTEARALGLKSVLGGVSALFVGGAGIATLIHTATAEFSGFVQSNAATGAILEATGHSAHVTAAGVQALATAIEHKTGIDDLQIRAAENVLLSYRRVRNEVGLGNDVFTRATRDSADLAKVMGGDTATAATQLGKALADPTRGVLLLRRANVSFTSDQIKTIKALADSGQVLKAQTLILDQVERSVGGTAAAIGRTLPGQLAILKERAKDALGEYVRRLSESRDAQSAVATGSAAVASGFNVVKGAVETLGPPLVTVAKGAHAVESAIGAGPIVAAVIGYKALGASVTLAGRAQGLYAKTTAIATGANAAEAASTIAATAALRAETASLAGVTVATRGYVTSSGLAVVMNDRLAASEVEVGLAARASAVSMGAGRLALAAVGGPLGAAALGVGALAAGFIFARRAADNMPGSLNAVKRAVDELNRSVEAGQAIRIRVTGGREAVTQTQAAAKSAIDALAAAQARQAASTAAPGSLEQRGLAEQVAQARRVLTQASEAATAAEKRLTAAEADQIHHQQQQPGVIARTTQRIVEQSQALRDAQVRTAFPKNALELFNGLMDKLAASGTRADRVAGDALSRISARLHDIPSEKQIKLVFTLAGGGRSVDAIVAQLGLQTRSEQILQREADARNAGRTAILGENTALEQQFAAAQKILSIEQKKLAVRKAAASTAISEAQSARDAVTSATDALTNANESLTSSQQSLADAIKNGQDAVTSAVNSAKTNLRSIAGQIADAIGQAADQGALKIGPQGPLSKKFQQLRDQILKGQGGPDTARAAQEVAARLQAQQPGDDVAARAKKRLDDLADSFDRGKTGAAQFNAGLQRILRESGLNLAQFGKTFGSAALNDLKDTIAAAKQQARAIAVGPTRPGGGQAPNIVRPLQAVAQAQRDTRDATKGVERATRDVARSQRELQSKQLTAQRDTVRELKAIRKATETANQIAKQKVALTKPKPTGQAGKDAQKTTTAGAGAP